METLLVVGVAGAILAIVVLVVFAGKALDEIKRICG